ncbi:MAG: cohesin domain-containing protein [Candidatus Poribacteria bacterium]|nr:cohesin domain-containing protein [Candidatus Poribacteria bacterium]
MKLLFSIATVFMFLGFTVGSYGQALVYVSSTQIEPLAVGEQMHLNIQIRKGGSVSGYELTVGFDPTALRYIEGTNADYLPAGAFAVPPIVNEGTVYVTATSGAEAAPASEGTLATLTFEVIAAKGSIIKLMDVTLSDSAGMPLAVATKNGQIVATDLPTIWDVNEDGKVNILDLTLVASNLMADIPVNPRVDVNKDGNVNILDLVLVAQNLDAAGGNEPEVRVKLVASTFASLLPFERNTGFAAEEEAIRELYDVYATAHGDQDVDVLGEVWFKSESHDVFTAWTFWAGTFERNNGWKAVTAAWRGIFRLRQGAVTVNITYIAIDSRRKEAILRGSYNWGNQAGNLISALQKDGEDWKIRAIDYTDGRFGKQVKDMTGPAYTFGEIAGQ